MTTKSTTTNVRETHSATRKVKAPAKPGSISKKQARTAVKTVISKRTR